ncbi:hypothetical protein BJ508DRAFT_416249 [Ascobolus immersus RN42]|uniref:Attractin/MKLN-like beta-propeller domain-containing protein n=1 Tax=Ascobolus immersus RN42 TaxID=1160509 RepID=A0A3N4I0B9_ASCIM|nr:hypothetical protein BJ508DRAFT_416249 [Ascobolus immersus RN42]
MKGTIRGYDLLVILVSLGVLEGTWAVYPESWCSAGEAKSAFWNDKMYIVGGHFDDVSNTKLRANTELVVLDFSRPTADFQTDTSLISTTTIPRSLAPSIQNWANVYASSSSLYIVGGDPVPHRPYDFSSSSFVPEPYKPTFLEGSIQVYDFQTSEWSRRPPSSEVPDSPSCAGSGSSTELGKAFILAGHLENRLIRPPSMLIHDMQRETWRNITVKPYLAGLEFAEVVPIAGKVGTNNGGVLIVFGGHTMAPGEVRTGNDYKRIHVYDISTDKWYIQPARNATDENGEVPSFRTQTCSVLASSEDKSSHNIYLYGGHDPSDKLPVYNEVWVLSIPSFTWTLLNSQGEARFDHTCQRAGGYLASWGGRNTYYTDKSKECTSRDSPLNVQLLDLGTGKWTSIFEKDKEYNVPKKLLATLGGDEKGGAVVQEPLGGYLNSEVALLFPQVKKKTSKPPKSNSNLQDLSDTQDPTDGNDPHGTREPNRKSPSIGAIIGGAVGGFVGVLLICLLIFFLIRRNRRSARTDSTVAELSDNSTGTERLWAFSGSKYGYYGVPGTPGFRSNAGDVYGVPDTPGIRSNTGDVYGVPDTPGTRSNTGDVASTFIGDTIVRSELDGTEPALEAGSTEVSDKKLFE